MGCGGGQEAVGSGLDQAGQSGLGLGGIEAATHDVHAGGGRGGGLFRGLHMDVGEAAFALELLEIVDGVLLAGTEHGNSVCEGDDGFNRESCQRPGG